MKTKLLIAMMFFLSAATLIAQQDDVTGTVTDETKQPLPGVNVVIKNTNRGVSTDFDGKYSVQVLIGAILEFSYLGYVTQVITVGSDPVIDVVMLPDASQLDEVVIIGYGTSSKKDLVSSVASVKSEVLENQPVARLDQALQGRAAGVSVTSNNGSPGAGSTIRIRGNSSINGNNAPLIVVDGFITGTGFDLNTLNVNDIKSVQILKDATALAIYGTRGAAGVILVTTKNGTELEKGKPKISVNHYTTIQNVANEIEILGGQEYINYLNEAGQFVPGASGFGETDSSLPLVYDNPGEVPVTDWLDLIEQTGIIRNTDLSIAGNSNSSNYYISLNHFDQKGLIRASGLERLILKTNIDVKLSDKLKFGVRFNGTHYKRENNKVNYDGIVTSVSPVRTVFDDDGNFTGQNPISSSTERNPEADIRHRVSNRVNTKILVNSYLEYELFKNFKLKTSFGADLTYSKNNTFLPGILPERVIGGNGAFASIGNSFTKSILNENTFTYKANFEDHSFKFLGGFTWQKNTVESSFASADNIPIDATSFNNLALGDPLQNVVGSGFSQRTFASFLGRINYGYKSKYLLTLVGRYDGSSVFEEGSKYAFFPSAGVAWNVSEENFIQNIDKINNLKLRASYGIVGEQGVSPYNSLPFYNTVTTVFNNQLTNGVLPARIPSKGLKWETTKQLDIGLELAMFNRRVSLEVDYYKKITEDLLLGKAISAQAGGGTQLQNIGSIENQGLEFTLNTVNIEKENFTWETQISISTNKSKVLELDGRDFINIQSTGNQGGSSARLIVGQRMPVFVGLKYLGTYKTSDEIIADNRVGLSFIGGPRFENLDDNPAYNNEDIQIIGSPEPDFYGGIRNTFTYKNLSLDIFFHGQYGNDIFNVRSQTSFFGRGDRNLDPRLVNRWIEGVNETSDIPRAGTSTSLFNPNSTVNIEDGSFLRLKQVSLNYDIPIKNTKLGNTLSAINVYVTGTNLLLFSDFKLGDPEANSITSNSGTNSVSQGFVSGQYPYARSFTLGLKIEF